MSRLDKVKTLSFEEKQNKLFFEGTDISVLLYRQAAPFTVLEHLEHCSGTI